MGWRRRRCGSLRHEGPEAAPRARLDGATRDEVELRRHWAWIWPGGAPPPLPRSDPPAVVFHHTEIRFTEERGQEDKEPSTERPRHGSAFTLKKVSSSSSSIAHAWKI